MSRRQALGTGLGIASATTLSLIADHSRAADAAPSSPQAAASPLAQEYSVVYHNEDPRLYVEGCGLARLPSGALLAAVPVVPRAELQKELRVNHSQTHIQRSSDGGKTWLSLATLPYYSGVPFVHGDAVFLFAFQPGAKIRNDDLCLLRSDDAGKTWSKPVTLFAGHFWNCQTGMAIRDGRLYWAVDDLSAGLTDKRTQRLIVADLSRDLMDPKSWRMSDPAPFPGVPPLLINSRLNKRTSQALEPNVLDVRGHLRVVTEVKAAGQTTTNLMLVRDVVDDGATAELKLVQFHPMPGGHLKFCVIRDEPSRLFWATANFAVDAQESQDWWDAGRKRGEYRATSSAGDDRRMLMLLYGVDGLNWFQAGCVARAGRIGQSFMYATPVVDGDDLAIISRSSIHAPHQHDADHATFHRVRNFRRLALNLFPDGA